MQNVASAAGPGRPTVALFRHAILARADRKSPRRRSLCLLTIHREGRRDRRSRRMALSFLQRLLRLRSHRFWLHFMLMLCAKRTTGLHRFAQDSSIGRGHAQLIKIDLIDEEERESRFWIIRLAASFSVSTRRTVGQHEPIQPLLALDKPACIGRTDTMRRRSLCEQLLSSPFESLLRCPWLARSRPTPRRARRDLS